jgi:hypothetical protein
MTWAPIADWVGFYEVSDAGEVRSLDRVVGLRTIRGRVLRRRLKQSGYYSVLLCREGRRWDVKIHRLVAETLIGPRPAGMQTCHEDGDKGNNALSNLRYDTKSSNEQDKFRHGTNHNSNKTYCAKGHPYDHSNTYWVKDSKRAPHRECRACWRERQRQRRQASAVAAMDPRAVD